MAEYHRELLKQYDLLFVDTSYGGSHPEIANTEAHHDQTNQHHNNQNDFHRAHAFLFPQEVPEPFEPSVVSLLFRKTMSGAGLHETVRAAFAEYQKRQQ